MALGAGLKEIEPMGAFWRDLPPLGEAVGCGRRIGEGRGARACSQAGDDG